MDGPRCAKRSVELNGHPQELLNSPEQVPSRERSASGIKLGSISIEMPSKLGREQCFTRAEPVRASILSKDIRLSPRLARSYLISRTTKDGSIFPLA